MQDMKWIEPIVFFQTFPETLYTDGRTDGHTTGQTSGGIQYAPIPPSVERGYNKDSAFSFEVVHVIDDVMDYNVGDENKRLISDTKRAFIS